jgi:hypothetical protein
MGVFDMLHGHPRLDGEVGENVELILVKTEVTLVVRPHLKGMYLEVLPIVDSPNAESASMSCIGQLRSHLIPHLEGVEGVGGNGVWRMRDRIEARFSFFQLDLRRSRSNVREFHIVLCISHRFLLLGCPDTASESCFIS